MELIKKIKQAETEAQVLIEQARTEAAGQADQARQQRRQRQEEAQSRRKKAVEAAVAQARTEAEKNRGGKRGCRASGRVAEAAAATARQRAEQNSRCGHEGHGLSQRLTMAIAPMTKVMIVCHRSQVSDLLEALQEEGICQILRRGSARSSTPKRR